MRVPGHVRPRPSKHLTCQSLQCGIGLPRLAPAAAQNRSCDIGARPARKSGGLGAGQRSESSTFFRHFRSAAAKRLKVQHPFEAPTWDADSAEQPSRRPTRWSCKRCLAECTAKTAYEIDKACRSLGHLHPPGAPTISPYVTSRERVGRTMEARASKKGDNDESEFESRVSHDLPIPSRGPGGSRGTSLWRDRSRDRVCGPAGQPRGLLR
ncbi:hypothetical protein V1290_007183 [Bradyrhizobium sp. AZCC 1578]